MIRTFLFKFIFFSIMTFASLSFFLLLPLPSIFMIYGIHWCSCSILFVAKYIGGIDYEIRGLENLPQKNGFIFASKHQSMWDTFAFQRITFQSAYVFKKELLYTLAGIHLLKAGMVCIDRSKGTQALKTMTKKIKKLVKHNRNVVIFPEGTRSEFDRPPPPYKAGIAFLYTALDTPIIPVALNSGAFWPASSFKTHPGKITLSILPPMEKNLSKKAFLENLQTTIEEECTRINSSIRKDCSSNISKT